MVLTRYSAWQRAGEVTKVAVGIISTGWLSPHLEQLIKVGVLSYIIGAIISAVAISVVSDAFLRLPSADVVWRTVPDGREVPSETLVWSKANTAKIYRYDISLDVNRRSVLGELLLRKWATEPYVHLSAGEGPEVAAVPVKFSEGLGGVRATDAYVDCRLRPRSGGTFNAWLGVEFELIGPLPSFDQTVEVKIYLSNRLGGKEPIPCYVRSNVRHIVVREG